VTRGRSIGSLRNLSQYQGMTDEEILGSLSVENLDDQVTAQLSALEKDYDFSDMKHNDLVLLKSMAMLMVRLEESEPVLEEKIRKEALSPNDALKEEQRLKAMRDGIRDLQRDLGILRVKRSETVEDNPRLLFDDVRKRAHSFLKERLIYVKCPDCQLAICFINFLYPEQNNKLTLTCNKCGKTFSWSSTELLEIEKDNPFK